MHLISHTHIHTHRTEDYSYDNIILIYLHPDILTWASQVALVVKNPPANAGDIRDAGSIPGLGISPGEGNGNSLQYSCLEKPMDRGAWQAMVHRVTRVRRN